MIQFEEKIAASAKRIKSLQSEIEELTLNIAKAVIGRELTPQREELCEQLKQFQEAQSGLNREIEKYIRFDPQRVELIKKQNEQLKASVNAWTDNLEQLRKFIKANQIGIKAQQIEEQYNIPADLDYIE